MQILSSSDGDLEKAAGILAAGGLVAFPTETVYGLGADAFNREALARVFAAKNRPRFDPLIIHIAELGTLSRLVRFEALDGAARERLTLLSERLWPGPLTFVLPKRPEVPDLATAGLATAAIRFPSHPAARKLIRLSTGAVAAPSANPFGYLSPTRAGHVSAQLGEKVDCIIDGGRTSLGLESTVLDLSQNTPRILRPGGASRESIEALIGPVEISGAAPSSGQQLSPGQLKSHYAPATPLVLYPPGALASLPRAAADEGRLYFSSPGNGTAGDGAAVKILSPSGDLTEAAANLFDLLHQLDSMALRLIRAEEAPGRGLGVAINDRLRRAANRGR